MSSRGQGCRHAFALSERERRDVGLDERGERQEAGGALGDAGAAGGDGLVGDVKADGGEAEVRQVADIGAGAAADVERQAHGSQAAGGPEGLDFGWGDLGVPGRVAGGVVRFPAGACGFGHN